MVLEGAGGGLGWGHDGSSWESLEPRCRSWGEHRGVGGGWAGDKVGALWGVSTPRLSGSLRGLWV